MAKVLKHRTPVTVDLTDRVSVRTAISQEHHPAMRSGFAGYPANPQWNLNKYQAWKVGKQLRDSLARGMMVVRQSDSLLVPAGEQEEIAVEDKPPSTKLWQSLLLGSEKVKVLSRGVFTILPAPTSCQLA